MSENRLSREMINQRYSAAVEYLIQNMVLRNQLDFAEKMKEDPGIISQIKKGKRNASMTMMVKLIDIFDLNANYFLRVDNQDEPIAHRKLAAGNTISVDNQGVLPGNYFLKNIGNVHGDLLTIKNHINEASPEVKRNIEQLLATCSQLKTENDRLKEGVNELKKTNENKDAQISDLLTQMNHLQTQIVSLQDQLKEKEERLYQAQRELIDAYKSSK